MSARDIRVTPAEAAAEVRERRPRLCEIIAGCLVGWPDEIPPIVYQALCVKIDEFLTEQGIA